MTDSNETNNSRSNSAFFNFATQDDLRKKVIIGVIIVVLALMAFGFMATRSLPGGTLYDIKTRVIENLNESVQTTNEGKAAYQAKRMRERLEELKTLAARGNMSEKAQEDLRTMTTLHAQTLSTVAALDANQTPTPDMLRAVSDFSDVAAAMETISEREDSLSALSEHLEDVRRDAVNTYQEQVDRYVERETPEHIYELVRNLLGEVSDMISNADISEETIDDAEVYINRVGPAMAAGDYPRAIGAIAEAKRFIMLEKYGALETPDSNTQENSSTTTATTSTTTQQAIPENTSTIEIPVPAESSFVFPD